MELSSYCLVVYIQALLLKDVAVGSMMLRRQQINQQLIYNISSV